MHALGSTFDANRAAPATSLLLLCRCRHQPSHLIRSSRPLTQAPSASSSADHTDAVPVVPESTTAPSQEVDVSCPIAAASLALQQLPQLRPRFHPGARPICGAGPLRPDASLLPLQPELELRQAYRSSTTDPTNSHQLELRRPYRCRPCRPSVHHCPVPGSRFQLPHRCGEPGSPPARPQLPQLWPRLHLGARPI